MALALSASLSLPLVSEAARDFLTPGQSYSESDLHQIALAQQRRERDTLSAGRGAILDTDISVIAIWWRFRFALSSSQPWPDWLDQMLRERSPRCYLLCQPDLPWQPDPLRESPNDRELLFQAYDTLLRENPYPWSVISGHGADRLANAQHALGLGR